MQIIKAADEAEDESEVQVNIVISPFIQTKTDYNVMIFRMIPTMVSGLPWVMKEWDWFFGTTTLTSGTLSLMPCSVSGKDNKEIVIVLVKLLPV